MKTKNNMVTAAIGVGICFIILGLIIFFSGLNYGSEVRIEQLQNDIRILKSMAHQHGEYQTIYEEPTFIRYGDSKESEGINIVPDKPEGLQIVPDKK